MGENTKTPRTDAQFKLTSAIGLEFVSVPFARELEADLQHLARVAGEALGKSLKVIQSLEDQQAFEDTSHRYAVAEIEAALSEINRIKQP